VSLGLAAGCFGERHRPAPPRLELLPDRPTVRSPDELTGTIRVQDPDGIDSVWLTVDHDLTGLDGLFREVVETRFRRPISAGLPPGSRVELMLRARDLAGFSHTIWDTVTVTP
jgi:hypothetical protein